VIEGDEVNTLSYCLGACACLGGPFAPANLLTYSERVHATERPRGAQGTVRSNYAHEEARRSRGLVDSLVAYLV
jgi:hypothetical protein